MGRIKASVPIKRATISAVIKRADGTIEDLGIISYYHRNPLMRLAYKVRELLKLW